MRRSKPYIQSRPEEDCPSYNKDKEECEGCCNVELEDYTCCYYCRKVCGNVCYYCKERE